MTNYSQNRISRLVEGGHITLLAEWININGRLDGHRLRRCAKRGEANWWCEWTTPAPHPSRFRLGKHDRLVAVVDMPRGRRTSVVAFRIADPDDWGRVMRVERRTEAASCWKAWWAA
jgi:hypothetical protein